MQNCPVCNASMRNAFSATLLRKHKVDYYHCQDCGLLQTEEPYWLDEAYGSAIADADTGLVQRNISIAAKLASILYFELDPKAAYLDVAGGYGMLARLMRDLGFDFYWSDKYCQNLLAKGFEAGVATSPFKALTAFEVMEHVHDPIAFVEEAMRNFGTRTLIFSTELYQGDPPAMNWWYYAFNTGQHVSFYQERTLRQMADRLGLNFYSAHGIHLLTESPLGKTKLGILTGRLSYLFALYIRSRGRSLTQADHERLMNLG